MDPGSVSKILQHYDIGHTRGIAKGSGIWGIYTPKKSVQVNFLWGKNDARRAIEHDY